MQERSSAVYQCNASNQYGYLLANAFVNILGNILGAFLKIKNPIIMVFYYSVDSTYYNIDSLVTFNIYWAFLAPKLYYYININLIIFKIHKPV